MRQIYGVGGDGSSCVLVGGRRPEVEKADFTIFTDIDDVTALPAIGIKVREVIPYATQAGGMATARGGTS